MPVLTKGFAAPAIAGALSLVAMPADAAMPIAPRPVTAADISHYGPYVGVSYGGGWGWGGGYRGRHRHRGSTAGDILTGVLILGTIAAVASAARRAERRPYPESYPFPERRDDDRRAGPQGLDGAADQCLSEIERDARAREVTRVERSASGWLVTGIMADGAAFTCSIGADGRIERIDVGGRSQARGEADGQYDDDRYRAARAEVERGAQPSYPGGPLPGEDAEVPPPSPSPARED